MRARAVHSTAVDCLLWCERARHCERARDDAWGSGTQTAHTVDCDLHPPGATPLPCTRPSTTFQAHSHQVRPRGHRCLRACRGAATSAAAARGAGAGPTALTCTVCLRTVLRAADRPPPASPPSPAQAFVGRRLAAWEPRARAQCLSGRVAGAPALGSAPRPAAPPHHRREPCTTRCRRSLGRWCAAPRRRCSVWC